MKSFLFQSQEQKKRLGSINGRWTKTEKERFMKGLERYGRDWVNVQKVVKTRTLTQVRSHAQKVFLKMSEKDIDSLIADESDYEVPIPYHISIFTETVKQSEKLESPLPRKVEGKNQSNLLEIFMKAIQNEQKEDPFQYEHTTFVHENNVENAASEIELSPEMQRNIIDGQYDKCNEQKNEAPVRFEMKPYSIYPIEIDLSNQGKSQ